TPQGDFPIYTGAEVVGTTGRGGVDSVTLRHQGGETTVEVDCLAVSGGWNPAVHLTCHMGGRPVWNPAIAAFVPQPGAVPGLDVAGAAAGVFSMKGVLKSGQFRVKKALEELGFKTPSLKLPEASDTEPSISAYWRVEGPGRAWLDMQNDVTVKDVALAAAENFTSVEHMKRYTTQGMTTDQ